MHIIANTGSSQAIKRTSKYYSIAYARLLQEKKKHFSIKKILTISKNIRYKYKINNHNCIFFNYFKRLLSTQHDCEARCFQLR